MAVFLLPALSDGALSTARELQGLGAAAGPLQAGTEDFPIAVFCVGMEDLLLLCTLSLLSVSIRLQRFSI